MNENTRLSTALFQQAMTNVLCECNENTLLLALKQQEALANWALAKMGNHSKRYLIRAIEDFVVQAAERMCNENWDAGRALKEIPFVVPTQCPGSNPSLYQLLTKSNLLEIKDEYEALCEKIREIKNRNKTSAHSFRRDLKAILNDCNQAWITEIKLSDEPSDIATLYLTKKYRRLRIKPEMLKKRLADVRERVGSRNMKDRARAHKKIEKTLELIKNLQSS